MKDKTKKWIKIFTYLLPMIWLLLRNFIPTFMQFATLDIQGIFLMFVLGGLCITMITFPKFDMFCTLFNGSSTDKKFTHASKVMFIIFMIFDVIWMLYSVSIFNVFTFWTNNLSQIIFLFSLTYYLWFSFAMNLIRYVDVKKLEEEGTLEIS